MKEKSTFGRVVLVLAAVVLLLMGVRFAIDQRPQAGPWQVEVERSDGIDTSASVSHSDWPDSLLEDEVINLNTAAWRDLARLPGIGETRAKTIVEYRQKNGPFRCVDDLMQVKGVGTQTLEQLRSYVTVG